MTRPGQRGSGPVKSGQSALLRPRAPHRPPRLMSPLTKSERAADEASMDADCPQDRFAVAFTAILLEVLDDLRDDPEVRPVRMLPRVQGPWFSRYRTLSPGKQALQVDEDRIA